MGNDTLKDLQEYLIDAATSQSEATRTANIAKIKQMGLPLHLKEGARSYGQARLEESLKLAKASEGGEGGKQPQQADPGKPLQIDPVGGDVGGTGVDVMGALTGLAEKAGLNLGNNQTGASGATGQGAPVDRRGQVASQRVNPPSTSHFSVGHPIANIIGRLTGATKVTKPSSTTTSWSKDNPSIDTHATSMASTIDAISRGNGSGDDLKEATKSAMAELGPVYGAEAVAEGKAMARVLQNERMIVEKAQNKETFETMTKDGYSPGLSLKYAQAKTLGEKATILSESNEVPLGVEADRLLIKIRNRELSIKRRADLASEAVQRQKQMQLQRQGLVGFLGLRATPEEVGQTLTEAQNAFKKVMDAGGGEGGGVLQAMLPQIQGNISKLSGDDWLLTKEPGIGEDRYKPYKTNEILIKFAEADGRWVEKGFNREQALEKRRKATAWLEKIHGIPTHDEQIVDGRLEFSWGHPTGPNAVRLNELMNTQRDHENLELQHGMAVRDFAPSAYPMAVRKEPDLEEVPSDTGFLTSKGKEAPPSYYPHRPPKIKETLDAKERLRRGLKTFIYGDSGQEK